MIAFPNAKINLGLHVTEKRPDGFHNIETVFYPVGWRDCLEIVENREWEAGNEKAGHKSTLTQLISPDSQLILSQSGLHIDGRLEDNLIYKAWKLVKQDYSVPAIRVHLHKILPMGAGLGGGSSDAAFFIRLLNDTFELGISWGEMHHYARQLGSDCSFFISNRPAFAEGKGDEYESIRLDLSAYKIAIVYPNIHSNTKEAYKGILPAKPQRSVEEIVLNHPVEEWKGILVNDFEKSIFAKYPRIAELKQLLYERGAVYASMSGSGSAVYGIFKEITEIRLNEGEVLWREE
ncbi:MAG: 4-(cytidine 5'-diphospho)-2-C-methyl-D-erythritol kinase [Bacteroidia bacterium]